LGPQGQHKHEIPMLSLEKAYTPQELEKWLKTFNGSDVIVTPKFDGCACHLGADPQGIEGYTRGNGKIGEVIPLLNLLEIVGIARPMPIGLQVRGEIVLPLSKFRTLPDQTKHPRNLASGALKAHKPDKIRELQLTFYAYRLMKGGPVCATEMQELDYLHGVGFNVVPYSVVRADVPSIMAVVEGWVQRMPSLDYMIDGIVLKVATKAKQDMGATSHHPKNSISYKGGFSLDSGISVVREIEHSVGRTGTITPVALLDPVDVGGTTISRVTVHNWNILRDLQLTIGSRVKVVRSGGVIPQIVGVLDGKGPYLPPAFCPKCGSDAGMDDSGFLTCHNNTGGCEASVSRSIQHYTKTLEIDGFGPAIVDQLVEAGLVTKISDLYNLKMGDVSRMKKMGLRSEQILLHNLREKASVPLSLFLQALGIPNVGTGTAERVSRTLKTIGAVMEVTDPGQLTCIRDVGELTAREIVRWVGCNQDEVDRILVHVDVTSEAETTPVPTGLPLSGKSFVFTGAVPGMTREQASARVQALGGIVKDSVTKDLGYLVVSGDRKSSKWEKAEKLQACGSTVQIINDSVFLHML
jgi:DNA ligase (NAD+)